MLRNNVILPCASEIEKQQARYVPLYSEFLSDSFSPISLYTQGEKLFKSSYILESVEQKEQVGRYSFVGFGSLVTLIAKENKLQIFEKQKQTSIQEGNIYEAVQNYIQTLKVQVTGLPSSYTGFVGYFSYDMIRQVEAIPDENATDIDLPEAYLILPEYVAVFDHFCHTLTFITYFDTEKENYEQAKTRFEKYIEILVTTTADVEKLLPLAPNEDEMSWESNMTEQEFVDIVHKAKDYITQGDIFQVVLSQRFSTAYDKDSLTIYRMLRHTNPSPYLFYLSLEAIDQYDAFQVVGSSPETLVKREEDKVILKPIAGTIKRGATQEEDEALEKKLLADPKEIAEHMMLVDLGRNDLGRFSVSGSVMPEEVLFFERYSHVIHLVTRLKSKVTDSVTNDEILMACSPAGTLSGAPKIRAMEIIDELEKTKRGIYGGSILQWNLGQGLNTCIAIRFATIYKGKAYVQAGAGIVADSNAQAEYEESKSKAKAVMQAIQQARKYDYFD